MVLFRSCNTCNFGNFWRTSSTPLYVSTSCYKHTETHSSPASLDCRWQTVTIQLGRLASYFPHGSTLKGRRRSQNARAEPRVFRKGQLHRRCRRWHRRRAGCVRAQGGCWARWLIYVPPGLTLNNSKFCPHSVFVLFGSENKRRLFPYTTLTAL
jgi:hypothetical protein